MSQDEHAAGGSRLDAAVAAAVARAATPEHAAAELTRLGGVVAASVRPGLVKTEPPQVELVVAGSGAGDRRPRVYDLAVAPDGGLRVVGVHEA